MKSLIFSGFLFAKNLAINSWILLFTIFFYRISTAKHFRDLPQCHDDAVVDVC